ncbi:MAG: glycerol-3-phosphate 1-O-acyltransferase PlsY [Candidatus Cloacimonetes bacterium]|nr:glycerol-3-phosphate 1-O-acyltransferase PlsY [Candidatus Cloacimonadota bacterium]MCF7813560.1 glycerol-3-phosphate 1-O-acyltransferase PlsY [Candidatus Cloacimonadota bacterium]MCF7868191.1 glycerol-3-phosphate 1-O-acyltransferase PlsY [Candidatus Cloacimonadota bacterium]MCF7883645.1 glycerol-3-phosphate 1-O-acyltransferase PlsY [Candidatus Cloacimonadota bacterium]
MNYFNLILSFIFAYLLGSIPTSYIMGKLVKGIDIRQHGSGNVGATNALRILGTKIGIITLIFDIGKGIVAVQIGKMLNPDFTNLMLIGFGLFAILGHIFTIFLSFKGGKGVATSAGVFIALIPVPVTITLTVFIVTVWISRYVSLGSILAAVSLFCVELIININNNFEDLEILIFVFLIAFFVVIRHTANIKRLLAGNENKISFKK